jgi:hypothetical protein
VRIIVVTLALALVLAACGGDDAAGDSRVQPFSEIQAGELSFEVDPLDPGRGIFRVTTTEPAICSITWGETEVMGNQNNSLSMNGTGIIQHDVILPGALPGETYYFRLQGSTADGQLFQSELNTFTLPDLEGPVGGDTADRGDNLALGAAVVEVSSEFNASFGASRALDGDLSTEWSTRGDGDEGFVVIDLGGTLDIGGVAFVTRSMADGSAITDQFTVSVDGGEPLGPFPAGSPADPGFQAVEASGRVLRFDIASSTGGNTGAVEIQVYGPQG